MKKLIYALMFLSAAAQAKTITVTMKSLSFDPKTVEAKVGDKIEWENKSYTDHSATADDGGDFDTGMVHPKKESKKIEMKKPGTIHYHCSLHGKTMSGTIEVKP